MLEEIVKYIAIDNYEMYNSVMNFKEAFDQVESSGKELTPVLKIRREINEIKKKLEDSGLKDNKLLKIKDRVIGSGILDTVSASLDYLPECDFFFLPELSLYDDSITLRFNTDFNEIESKWDQIAIRFPTNKEAKDSIWISFGQWTIHRGSSAPPYWWPMDRDHETQIELSSVEWNDSDLVNAAMADAVWKMIGESGRKSHRK